MILSLFGFFVLLSLVFIVLGIYKEEESFFAVVGFFFLFLLSFQIINGTLEYPLGENSTITYSYDNGSISKTDENMSYHYGTYQSHLIGYWLAIVSALGFATMMFQIKRGNKKLT